MKKYFPEEHLDEGKREMEMLKVGGTDGMKIRQMKAIQGELQYLVEEDEQERWVRR